jgi:thymidylate synthase
MNYLTILKLNCSAILENSVTNSKNYFPNVWLNTLNDIMEHGITVKPRGQMTKELPQRTIVVDTRRPVLNIAERRLSYQFMAAEAYWILSGDDRVETIAPYNEVIEQFSDDGIRFFGAYGPKIVAQLPYILAKLVEDPDTRQAGLTIWRENPPPTKDMPCTVSIFFSIRDSRLNCHVFMRSSDAWLGIPYDVFNFSMLAHLVCAVFNGSRNAKFELTPGLLYLTAASSHLYLQNKGEVEVCRKAQVRTQPPTPMVFYKDPNCLMSRLKDLRTSKRGDVGRWWEL